MQKQNPKKNTMDSLYVWWLSSICTLKCQIFTHPCWQLSNILVCLGPFQCRITSFLEWTTNKWLCLILCCITNQLEGENLP
jgi:hypothetical protein